MNIRRAVPGESKVLSELAVAAKSLWGYSAAQLASWANDLRISPESIANEPTFVAERDGMIVGVVQIGTSTESWTIEHLWVRPEATARGVGSNLLHRALHHAQLHGRNELTVDADPNARQFYVRWGARQVGSVPAPIEGQPGRVRPQFLLLTQNAG